MINEFKFAIEAMLDKVKSLANFKNDIKSIEPKLPKVKFQGTFDDQKVKKEISSKLKNTTFKIKVDADTKQAESKIEKLTKKQRYVNISPKVNNTQLTSDFKDTEKQTQSFFDKFTNNIAGLNVLRIAFYKVAQAASKAVENVKDLDTIKTNIQMAAQVSNSEADNMMKTYNQMGKELSSTTKKVAESADEFIRMGESVSSTNELIKNAQMLSAIGKIDNTDSASFLISGMKGYKIAAQDSIKIVDKLTSVDVEAAISAGGLAEALSKTSNIANSSGVSLDRLIGYMSVVGETTQKSMSEVGNSFQSIFSRMNNIKINRFIDDETGESLSDTETVLNKLGIKLRDTADTYRDFDDVLDDVGKRWNTFTQVEQNAISVAVAGTRQRENFTALMNRYGDALKYTEVAANSSGTAMKRYEQYQDSIDAKTNKLTNSLEALSMNTISEDLYKGILEATTGIVEFVDKTNLLKGSLAGLATYGASKMFVTMASGIISATKSTVQLTSVMAMFNNGRSAENLEAIGKACIGLTDSQMKLVLSTTGLTNAQRLFILQGKGVEESQRQQTLTTLGFSQAENAATVSTFSFTGALNSLKAAFVSNPIGMAIMAVTTAVSIGTLVYSNYKQSLEETRQATSDAAKAFDESASSINDYADKYKKLHDELTNANTTEERQQEIKSDLLSLQQELNDKYGEEYGNLNLVTEAYKDQTEAILAMNKATAQKFLNENAEGIEDTKTQMTSENTYMIAKDVGMYSESGSNILDLAKQMGLDVDENESAGTFTVRIKANASDAYDSINDFMNQVNTLQDQVGKDDSDIKSTIKTSSAELQNAEGIIDDVGDTYNKALIAEITTNDKLSQSFENVKDVVREYNDALASGDEAKILSARDNLNKVKNSIDLTSTDWKDYASIVTDVFDQADTGLYDFRDNLNTSTNNLNSFAKILKDKDLSKEDLLAMADDDNPDYFDRLVEAGEKYDLTVEQIIDELIRMGVVQGDVAENGNELSQTFSSAFSSLPIDKLEEYVSLVKSGNIDEKNISSYSELNDLMQETGTSAEDAVSAMKDYADGFTMSTDLTSDIQEAYDLLQNVSEQYKETGKIGLSSLESIANKYPQLRSAVNEYTQGLISADDMMAQLQTAYDNDATAYQTAMAYKLSGDEEFFRTIVVNNQSLFNELSNAYGLDVNNWKTMAQAKAAIDQKLIQSLKEAWSKYYNIVFDSVSGLASITGDLDYSHVGSQGMGTNAEDYSEAEIAREKAWSEATKQANKYNQIIKGLNEAAAIQIDPPDFDGIGSVDSSGSSSKEKEKTEKDIDWIERKTKIIEDNYAKLEELANKDTVAYLGLTQEEFDKAKSIFDNGLGNSVEGLSQLQSYADKAGLSLGELYTMIQSGAPSASKENALQSMLQMQTETLLPQYQSEVEAYSKAYEDALKAIPSEYKDKIENGGVDIESLPSDLAEKVQAAIDANEKLKSSEKQLSDGETEHIETIKKLHENRIDSINIENEKLEQSNKIIKSQIELMEARGEIAGADFYERQINNNKGLISGNEQDIDEWESEMDDLRAANVSTKSEVYKDLQAKVKAAKNEIQSLKLDQEELNQTLENMPIDNLNTLISMYGDITTAIEKWGEVQTASGKKLNGDYYQTLISNGSSVINQYQKQAKLIKEAMEDVEEGSSRWKELYSQLQSVNSEMSSMVENLAQWNEELLNMPLENIENYNSNLQKVIDGLTNVQSEYDEVVSAVTGVLKDQIETLENQQGIAEDAAQAEIDALNEKLNLLDEQNEKLKLQMSLEQAEYNLSRSLSQKVNTEVRDGEVVWVNDYDAVREAQEAKINAQYDIDKYNLEQQIEDAEDSLSEITDSYEDQIEALQTISDKWSEISDKIIGVQDQATATSVLGEGWVEKVLSGNDSDIYNLFTSLYQTNAEQLEEYQKQADSTENIYSLLEDYIASYKSGEITYTQAMTKINDLLSQMNDSLSATDNLQNILDYLGTVNGTESTTDAILSGIQNGLSTTANELIASLEQYNENAGTISEYTSSWQELVSDVEEMNDVLKEVRDNLQDALDDSDSDDDSDDSSDSGWGSDDADNGPGVKSNSSSSDDPVWDLIDDTKKSTSREDGITRGLIGSTSDSDREASMKLLGLRKLDPDEIPAVLHMGEAVFNKEQQQKLLENFNTAWNYKPNLPDYSSLSNVTVRETSPEQKFIFNGGINIQKADNEDELAKGILNGKLELALNQRLGKR